MFSLVVPLSASELHPFKLPFPVCWAKFKVKSNDTEMGDIHHTVRLWQGRSPGPHSVPAMGAASQAHVQPCHCALPGHCSYPGQQIDLRDLPHPHEGSWFWAGPGPHFLICPLTLPCVWQPWAARHWHRELHSFWHPSCWIMCEVLSACEHLKLPSYLFHQNRSIISRVVIRLSLSDYIWASQSTSQASFVETYLHGSHSGRKNYLSFLKKKKIVRFCFKV